MMNSQDYSIVVDSNFCPNSTIYNIKLTEELVEKLMKGQKDLNNLTGIEFHISDKGIDKLQIGSECFHFMKVKESHPVHLLSHQSDSSDSNELKLLGTINQKLNPKLELEASKAEAIRQRSQEAEKERLSRKTVELDASTLVGKNQQQKKLIKRRPSITISSSVKTSNTVNTHVSTVNTSNTTNTSNTIRTSTPSVPHTQSSQTPPETPETPSPKKQIFSANFPTRSSVPSSAKKVTTAKDRLSAIMKRRR